MQGLPRPAVKCGCAASVNVSDSWREISESVMSESVALFDLGNVIAAWEEMQHVRAAELITGLLQDRRRATPAALAPTLSKQVSWPWVSAWAAWRMFHALCDLVCDSACQGPAPAPRARLGSSPMPQVLFLTAWQSRRNECDESVVCDRGDVVQCVWGGAVRECVRWAAAG